MQQALDFMDLTLSSYGEQAILLALFKVRSSVASLVRYSRMFA